MIRVFVLAFLTGLALSTIENANTRTRYQAFNLPVPLNMSEDDMKVKDLSSFVRHHRNSLRIKWFDEDPDPENLKGKIFELMKQAIYEAQDRVKHLENILNKYTKDVIFRLGFIFMKLDQLLEDLKRIYSIAVTDREVRNRFHVMYYEHAVKKNIDITYIVEFVINFHTRIYNSIRDITQNPGKIYNVDLTIT